LQKIKKELLHAGNLVDFNASRLTNRDPDSPTLDAIYKHIKDIESATVIRIVERYDGDGFGAYAYSLDAEAGVSGYKFLVDREKFETFYHAMVEVKVHKKDLSSDDAADFNEEKERIGAIKHEDDHKIELSRWTWMKNILDQIYVQLSPNASHGQTVRSIDISKVPESISRGVLDDLWDRGICGYGGIMSGYGERVAMRNGNHILVKDVDRFRAYRDGVYDFVKWIEQDSAERFSEKQTDDKTLSDETPLEKLSPINFLSVCDVAMDIEEQLQITDEDVVYIPVVKKGITRFPILFPAPTINLMDEYGDHRVGGAIYLKNHGSILSYEFQRGPHRWDTNMKITLESKEFRRFYEGLQAVYQKYREKLLEDEQQKKAPEEAGESVAPNHARPSKIDEGSKIKENEKKEGDAAVKQTVILKGHLPSFGQKGDIKIGEDACHIAEIGDLQYHICKELLTEGGKYKLGNFISQTELQDRYAPFGVAVDFAGAGGSIKDLFRSERWLKDAVRLINGKTKTDFGAELFEFKSSQARVKIELFR
jgi:hypothetical protein